MAASLPPIPRVVFTVLEPLSLLAGFLGAVRDPMWFAAEQVPPAASSSMSPNAVVLALQLGNLYLLMSLVGVAVLYTTSELSVVRRYLFALWLGDIGHVIFSCRALGLDLLARPLEWNAMAWGNIAATVFLFGMRSAYFLGVFGPDKPKRRPKSA
ncbi:hypothetical protein CP533_6408 [Ophiocordyceps camponoti-saundersi (nom. inval.)]|nr:hypothetical protein CP533_6408 [Ophiocordyceps camponoti-saundersi (nom. inval.)]